MLQQEELYINKLYYTKNKHLINCIYVHDFFGSRRTQGKWLIIHLLGVDSFCICSVPVQNIFFLKSNSHLDIHEQFIHFWRSSVCKSNNYWTFQDILNIYSHFICIWFSFSGTVNIHSSSANSSRLLKFVELECKETVPGIS